MRKKIFLTLTVTLIALVVTSCSKSTKPGIANAWRVISDYETITDENGSTYILNKSDAPGNPNELTISEDGTWTWNKKSTYNATVFGGSIFLTIVTTTEQKGTLNSVQRIGEQMKGEYVLFNTLSESTTTTQTGGGGNPNFPDTTTYDSKMYEAGENVIVYKVVKWDDNNLLQLESENTKPNSSGELKNSKLTLLVK